MNKEVNKGTNKTMRVWKQEEEGKERLNDRIKDQ